jgi:hypothetical protein
MMSAATKTTRFHGVSPEFVAVALFALYRNRQLYKTATNIVTLIHVVRHNPDFANGEQATIVTYNFSSAIDVRADQS